VRACLYFEHERRNILAASLKNGGKKMILATSRTIQSPRSSPPPVLGRAPFSRRSPRPPRLGHLTFIERHQIPDAQISIQEGQAVGRMNNRIGEPRATPKATISVRVDRDVHQLEARLCRHQPPKSHNAHASIRVAPAVLDVRAVGAHGRSGVTMIADVVEDKRIRLRST
jgi:hypothetical protein